MVKIALSRYADLIYERINERRLPPESNLMLGTIIENEVKQFEVFRNEDVVPSEEELNDALRPKVEEVIGMMKRLAINNNIPAPDIIILLGKSSALPIINETIKRCFPKSKIQFPPELRENVVLGAYQLLSVDLESEVCFNLGINFHKSATTSRLGIRVNEAGRLRFREIIDVGIPIPIEGIRRIIKGIVMKRNSHILILENTGLNDELIINGQENPNINMLKRFYLERRLDKWEKEHGTQISDQRIFDTEIELEVTYFLDVHLLARIPGIKEAMEFEPVFMQW
jgi:hypothetical protein